MGKNPEKGLLQAGKNCRVTSHFYSVLEVLPG
jgi:hypothetical protein